MIISVQCLLMPSQLPAACVAAGPTGMAFVFTWLRLSSNKQLAWYRRSAHQGKDIAHSQKVIAQRCADKARPLLLPPNPFVRSGV